MFFRCACRSCSYPADAGELCKRSTGTMPLACLFVLLLLGCRTPYYTAKTLPPQLHADPVSTKTDINLQQLIGNNAGTLQIGPGDLVEITIVSGSGEERPLPTPARVAEDGTVMVPLVGGVKISGLEPVAAEQQIATAAIERNVYRQPYVTLTVKERALNRVTVLGAVVKPGVVELPRNSCDLARALAAAGGLSKEASTQIEVLHRYQPTVSDVGMGQRIGGASDGIRLAAYTNLESPVSVPFAPPLLEGKSTPIMTRIDLAQANTIPFEQRMLQDQDVVMVLPEEKRVIHVTGLVRKPNQFEVPKKQNLRVLDAIALAGGTSSPVADKVYIIRQLPGMEQPVVIKVSMAAAKKDGSENLRLAAGDLVSVESTMMTATVDSISKFLRIGLGLNGRLAAF